MKIGIGIGEIAGKALSLDGVIEEAQRAEADGFSSVWLANIFGVDALTVAALVGSKTSRIGIGTGVVPSYPRHPFAMAQQAMTVNAACKGRFTLGIGLSHQVVIEGMLGMSYAKSYSHMREYLSVLAPLIREGRVDYQGELYKVKAPIRVPDHAPFPILVAALAPKMLALAGSVADGTITWMTGVSTLASHIVPSITAAARDAGRPAPRVVAGLPIAVTDDADAARAVAAKVFVTYGSLPSYRAMLDREGVAGPADIAVVGDEASVSAQLDALEKSGVTEFMAAPFPVGERDASLERTRKLLLERSKR